MKRFKTKLYICLTEPRKMGFFMGEKKWKTFLQLFIMTFIALIPYLIRLSNTDELSNESVIRLKETLMTNEIEANIKLSGGFLSGDSPILVGSEEAVIFINPLDAELDTAEYSGYPVFEFNKESVNVYYQNMLIYESTYENLGYLDIDFNKILKSDYFEFSLFISLIDDVYKVTNNYWTGIDFAIALIMVYLSLIVSALILAAISSFVNGHVSFKFRFKGALDAQFIAVLFILFMHLFSVPVLEYVGISLSVIYLFRALRSIVRIEVRKIKKESGEN